VGTVMMVYFFFILFLFSGLIFGILVFMWALKNGQFKDQQRARYLAIDEDEIEPVRQVSGSNRYPRVALMGLLIFGLLSIATIVVYAHLI
jgi:cbb3-type cytochrome oxidase maturation protein